MKQAMVLCHASRERVRNSYFESGDDLALVPIAKLRDKVLPYFSSYHFAFWSHKLERVSKTAHPAENSHPLLSFLSNSRTLQNLMNSASLVGAQRCPLLTIDR